MKKPLSPLVAAATALEAELERIASVAREAQRLPLDSQRNVERTAEKLAELGAVDAKLGPLVQELMSAVSALVQGQHDQAVALAARAEEVRARREVLRELLGRYAGLGRDAQELNAMVQAFASGAQPGAGGAEPPSFDAVRETMTRLIGDAEAVARASVEQGFEDLSRQADGLRQQLLSARNKLNLLDARAERAGPPQ
ncbi:MULTISPECIES: hypothetical protein [Anaeromyxobacter]|uniref:hypothetical protein n=1 Tax=Anaeromyxobacter TaxID=161492 RepID=UPI001F5ABB8D|nr:MULTISPECIES: hypothetical protein [unclassified Anaeromyxobacter]